MGNNKCSEPKDEHMHVSVIIWRKRRTLRFLTFMPNDLASFTYSTTADERLDCIAPASPRTVRALRRLEAIVSKTGAKTGHRPGWASERVLEDRSEKVFSKANPFRRPRIQSIGARQVKNRSSHCSVTPCHTDNRRLLKSFQVSLWNIQNALRFIIKSAM